MKDRGPWPAIAAIVALLVVIVAGGTALGVGPLGATPPPSEVADPREMIARSLQATIDASAVHLEGTLSGTIPGRLVDRSEDAVSLDGSTVEADLRPKDAKTALHVVSPGLEVDLETITVWDGVWYRTGPDQPWQRATLGAASAEAGVDINPLTLVDRLRAFLATPGITPVLEEVACASASGQCHRVTLDAGRDPATILRSMLPPERAAELPPIRTTLTLDTDAQTLRPARLVLEAVSEDGTVDLRLELDASDWDSPEIMIEEPPAGD